MLFRKSHCAELTIVQLQPKAISYQYIFSFSYNMHTLYAWMWSTCCFSAAYHTTSKVSGIDPRVVLEVSEISCWYPKPAGRLWNSWGCRGKSCREDGGTWSDMHVRHVHSEMELEISVASSHHIVRKIVKSYVPQSYYIDRNNPSFNGTHVQRRI